MDTPIRVNASTEPIDSLRPHPDNARVGDVEAITASLRSHGQYRPIVVQTGTRHILAGNHTWRAAKALGWSNIAVTWLDCDAATARKVLIADNRAADLASYDQEALTALLTALPTLEGTGFDPDALEALTTQPDASGGEGGALKEQATKPDIAIGTYQMWIALEPLEALKIRCDGGSHRHTADRLRAMLGFPPAKPTVKTREPATFTASSADLVDIDTLRPFAGNARQGDIGAISESLRHLGQYRPIVVNRTLNEILVGNHTWMAAKALGWQKIAVTWVDVDPATAAQIVLIDNRTSDLATYDEALLLNLLRQTDLTGTGFTNDDLDDLLSDVNQGRSHRNPAKTSDIKCRVADWSWKVPRPDFDAWDTQPDQYAFIIKQLDLPVNCWTSEEPS